LRTTNLLFRGQRARRAGRVDEALESLGRAAAAAPGSPHVALHHALALADAGRLDEALERLYEGGARWPENPVFPLFRGALLAEHDRLDEAQAALAAARQLAPGNLLAEAYRALIAMRRGRVEAALRRLGAAGVTDNPRALAALLAEVEAELFRRFGPDTDERPQRPDEPPAPPERLRRANAKRLAAQGLARLERGDARGAWPLLQLAAEKNPSLPDVLAHLGFAAFDLGRHEQALAVFERVPPGSAQLDAVHLHRGACLYRLGRLAEALEALEAAREADELGNYTAWIHFYLARTLIALGRRDAALPHLRKHIELEGDLAIARLRKAREFLGLAVPASAPPGFEVIEEGRTVVVVKPEFAEAIRERRPAASAEPAKHGRGPLERIAIPDGVALVRPCRRGGLLGRLLGDKHFDGTRFVHEIAVSEAVRRRGIPTPEILGGIRREVLPGLYRTEIVSREVPDSRDLAEALRDPARTHDLLLAAARLVRQMHDAGLRHADLNARNLLVRADGEAMVLDLDGAELLDELPTRARIASLARLYRSLHKLGLAPVPVSDDAWKTFYRAYAGESLALRDLTVAVLNRCRRELWWHRLGWRLTGGQAAAADRP